MTQHTPGPWHALGLGDQGEDTTLDIAIVRGVNAPALIATVHADDGIEDEANARLIAAAPNLLAAVIRLLSALTDDHECVYCGLVEMEDGWVHDEDCPVPIGEAVIRKATGEGE